MNLEHHFINYSSEKISSEIPESDTSEWCRLWHIPRLEIELYQAVCIKRSFPVHMHDYYVICSIERGNQSFTHRKNKYLTPPGGLILLNPGDDHTGEPADEQGFEYRALYPTVKHIQDLVFDLTGRHVQPVNFSSIIINDASLTGQIRTLHKLLVDSGTVIELETIFYEVLSSIVMRYAELQPEIVNPQREKTAVKRACCYIHDHLSEGVTLAEIAEHAGFSRYYLLRTFHNEMGMPPHAYLESVRINKSKQLLEKGLSLVQVAFDLGYSDQSHFTNTFRRYVGITPGQYVKAFNS